MSQGLASAQSQLNRYKLQRNTMAGFHPALMLLTILAVEGRWLPNTIVANPSPFNGCDIVFLLAYSPIETSVTYTEYYPDYENRTILWNTYTITGATCSTLWGETANLDTIPYTYQNLQLRCACRGALDIGADRRDCKLYIWRCKK